MKWWCLQMLVVACFVDSIIAYVFADAKKCVNNPCRNGGSCQPHDAGYNWGYRCICPAKFFGSQCQWDNATSCNNQTSTPCFNGGLCSITQDGRVCICPEPHSNRSFRYGGHYCEIEDPCASCPSEMFFCHSMPMRLSGRICLNVNSTELSSATID